jgi:hypothetical protein
VTRESGGAAIIRADGGRGARRAFDGKSIKKKRIVSILIGYNIPNQVSPDNTGKY